MVKLHTDVRYERSMRYLGASFGKFPNQLGGAIHWNRKTLTGRHWKLGWYCWNRPQPHGTLTSTAVTVYPDAPAGRQVYNTLITYPYTTPHTLIEFPIPAAGSSWNDFFEIARFVAAGRCDAMLLAGWIEDKLPHPWNLIASPCPADFIRAISPYPLPEGM